MAGRPIVVDGSNVAHEEASADGTPRMSNIVAMRRELEAKGFDATIIVDATLRHDVDDPDQLEALLDAGQVHQAPAGTVADTFVLLRAEELDCDVVSNDTFDEFRERHPWIDERRVPYMIIDGSVLLQGDPPAEDAGD